MLILTRKLHERIKIGDEIAIEIVRIASGRVRIGIEAPAHLHVIRGDLQAAAGRSAAAVDDATACT